mgnify:CR=1 FL=1
MEIDITRESGKLYVCVEERLYNSRRSDGADKYYPETIKYGTPRIRRKLDDMGVSYGALVEGAVLDNRSEETRCATWVFEVGGESSAPAAPRVAKKTTPRRRKTKAAETTTEEG